MAQSHSQQHGEMGLGVARRSARSLRPAGWLPGLSNWAIAPVPLLALCERRASVGPGGASFPLPPTPLIPVFLPLCVPSSRSHPGYFGKVGMRYFHKTNNQYFCKTINVDKLFTLVDAETVKAAEERKASGEALVVDVTKHGIMKVLGNGRLPALPVVVKARFFSKLAEKKIKEAGGVCELTA